MCQLWLHLIFLVSLLLPSSGGCELDQASLEFWAQVEEIYNQEDRYPDSLLSTAQQMNSQTYEMFFKYCACKHDIFIKNETICKYVFHTSNSHQRTNNTASVVNIQLPYYEVKLSQTKDRERESYDYLEVSGGDITISRN